MKFQVQSLGKIIILLQHLKVTGQCEDLENQRRESLLLPSGTISKWNKRLLHLQQNKIFQLMHGLNPRLSEWFGKITLSLTKYGLPYILSYKSKNFGQNLTNIFLNSTYTQVIIFFIQNELNQEKNLLIQFTFIILNYINMNFEPF